MQVAEEEPHAAEREAQLRTVFHYLPLFEKRPRGKVSVLTDCVKKTGHHLRAMFASLFVNYSLTLF
jgi:hypothetical protein